MRKLQLLILALFLMLPMTIGLSFLAEPVWMLFYGTSKFGPSVLAYFIFVGLHLENVCLKYFMLED